MKKILILSGKGGTGKTTLAAALIKLANLKAFADCDVDAPNLHLVTKFNEKPLEKEFLGMQKALINPDSCVGCGRCQANCRFDAIHSITINARKIYKIEATNCEGCGVCELVCPAQAITMVDDVAGNLTLYKENNSTFATAKLVMGRGNSGLLVTSVKKMLYENLSKDFLETKNPENIAIIDGSPGIGCPVLASINGVNMVLLVTEPSISGLSDLERIALTTKRLGIETKVIINKYDANLTNTKKIIDFCKTLGLEIIGKLPFDKEVPKAINAGKTIADTNSVAKKAVIDIIKNIDLLKERI